MPKTLSLQTPQISTRLAREDRRKFERIASEKGMKLSELMREAALAYIERYEAEEPEGSKKESVYAQQLKASTNRICALVSKMAIDAHATLLFLSNLEQDAKLAAECRAQAINKIRQQLTAEEKQVFESIKKFAESK
jgi:hypothetical protein